MTVTEALALIEEGATVVGAIVPGAGVVAATVDEVAKFAELIAGQIQTYQVMSGQPIEDVIALLTDVNPDPTVVP